jgi:hypothetical protein
MATVLDMALDDVIKKNKPKQTKPKKKAAPKKNDAPTKKSAPKKRSAVSPDDGVARSEKPALPGQCAASSCSLPARVP